MQSAQFELHAEIEERHWWFVARRRILEQVIKSVLPPSRATTIVDVGCGTGANLAALANEYECVGIDASQQAVRLAAERYPNIRFIHGLAPRDLGAVMDRAKLVLLTDVLEHVADDFEMFSDLLSAAQPGTYFLVTVPADPALWSEHDRSFGHYRRYDVERFRAVRRGLAARERFVSPFNARLLPIVKTVRYWNRRQGRAGGMAGTDFRQPGVVANSMLTRCFAGEGHRLARLARGEEAKPFRAGVSLMALVQRQAGPVEPRHKPLDIAADIYDPAAELATSGVC